jgi:hypothetical protein
MNVIKIPSTRGHLYTKLLAATFGKTAHCIIGTGISKYCSGIYLNREKHKVYLKISSRARILARTCVCVCVCVCARARARVYLQALEVTSISNTTPDGSVGKPEGIRYNCCTGWSKKPILPLHTFVKNNNTFIPKLPSILEWDTV